MHRRPIPEKWHDPRCPRLNQVQLVGGLRPALVQFCAVVARRGGVRPDSPMDHGQVPMGHRVSTRPTFHPQNNGRDQQMVREREKKNTDLRVNAIRTVSYCGPCPSRLRFVSHRREFASFLAPLPGDRRSAAALNGSCLKRPSAVHRPRLLIAAVQFPCWDSAWAFYVWGPGRSYTIPGSPIRRRFGSHGIMAVSMTKRLSRRPGTAALAWRVPAT